MKCGDVCLVHYPFTDASGTKLRPVLIVSSAKFNGGDDVVVVPISSRPEPDDQFSVYIDSGTPGFTGTGLRYGSSIKWTKPLTIAKSVVSRRLGFIPQTLLTEVRDKIRTMFVG